MKISTNRHFIDLLISEGEHQQQDFKFEISNAKKIAKSLSAFANTDGGRLLIGVKDNGKIAGIQSEEELYMIEAAADLYKKVLWSSLKNCLTDIVSAPALFSIDAASNVLTPV